MLYCFRSPAELLRARGARAQVAAGAGLLLCGAALAADAPDALRAAAAADQPPPSALEFRRIAGKKPGERSLAKTGTPVPRDAVRVFAYEGGPCDRVGF